MKKNYYDNWKMNLKRAAFPGVLIGTLISLGNAVKYEHGFTFTLVRLGVCLLLCAISVIAISLLYGLWDRQNLQYSEESKVIPLCNKVFPKSWTFFLFSFVILFVLWLPSLLAFYPGIYAYDASWQYDMYMQGIVSEHHPVIHTYLVGWLIDTFSSLTGQFNKGILAYTLVQELLMALGCGFIFYELHRRKSPTWMHIVALVMFVFYPPFVIFVFTSTKDSLFAIAIADFALLSLSMVEDATAFFERTANRVLWIVFALEIAILRNNSVYAILLTVPFLIVFMAKADGVRIKAFRTLGIAVAIFLIYKYPITDAITSAGVSKAEMLSVPAQQIMRVYTYHGDELTAEEKEAVECLFDREKWDYLYNPYIADPTKGSLTKEALDDDFGDFKALWFRLFREYHGEYVDSFLENTYGFWYPWPVYTLYSFGGTGYTPIRVMDPGEANTKLPALLKLYKMFDESGTIVDCSIVSWLFAPATFLYAALVVAFYVLNRKKKAVSIIFLYLGLLWLTYLLGPVAMVRYALYLYALMPVWPAYIMSHSRR